MFDAAGYTDFEHHIQQATPRSPRAITTVAQVPPAEEEPTAASETAGEAAAD